MRTIPPAVDQGGLNNCKAHAVAYCLQAAYGKQFDVNWLMGMLKNTETRIEHLLETIKQRGALPVGGYSIDPTWTDKAREWVEGNRHKLEKTAAKYKITEYKRITSEDALKNALNDGWYVVFSVACKTQQVDADGVYRPYSGTDYGMAHAMSAWSVNPDGTIRVLNSWGKNWGDNGQANMLVEDILRGKEPDCWAFRLEGEEMRKKFVSAVPTGYKVALRSGPSTTTDYVYNGKEKCYLRAVDDGVILSKRDGWCEVSVAQTADLTVTGWVQAKYVKEED
jgi:hypothetical protein